MIMVILTHSDMNHSDHERWSCILRATLTIIITIHSDHERWSWILRANPDDDHGEDPGVDEVLDPVADGVDGKEASLEVGVEVPTHSFRFAQSLAAQASRK